MNSPPAAGKTPSVLQQKFELGDLLDLDSFREVCQSYAELFEIGFKIFDRVGELLIDVKGSAADFCSYIFHFPAGKSHCMREVATIRQAQLDNHQTHTHECFSGLRYLMVPITHEGDQVGRVVYGPYRPAEGGQTDLSQLGPRHNPEQVNNLLAKVRRVPNEVALRVVSHLAKVVEVMVYTGYKQLLTMRMHIESVSDSYAELQKTNRRLQESFERLKELDRLKSNFLATVSHELRTPLTSVIGYSEMLLEGLAGELSAEQLDYVQTIMDKGENLLSLISGILDFSKVESGKLVLNRKPANIQELIHSAISTVAPISRKRNIRIETQLEYELPLVTLDADKVRQVLVNIIGNAVKFSREASSVRIMASVVDWDPTPVQDDVPAVLALPRQQWVAIQVADQGIGIPEDQLERIFDSFYQVDSSSTREFGGTGLGLAISRGLIQAHGGKIQVSSQLGRGSTFGILLPKDEPA